jgi:phage terminase large subunit GpA-like protein
VIDAGDGNHHDAVTSFTEPRTRRRIYAGKVASGTRPGFAWSRRVNGSRSPRLAIVGVDVLKSMIFEKLARGTTIRFSMDLPEVYYEQLASERRVIRYSRGRPTRRFERVPGKRAEALDALVYAFSARTAAPVVFDAREDALRLMPLPPPPRVIPNPWMER